MPGGSITPRNWVSPRAAAESAAIREATRANLAIVVDAPELVTVLDHYRRERGQGAIIPMLFDRVDGEPMWDVAVLAVPRGSAYKLLGRGTGGGRQVIRTARDLGFIGEDLTSYLQRKLVAAMTPAQLESRAAALAWMAAAPETNELTI